VRIATRASALALAQARQVADLLGGAELVTLSTSGDRGSGKDDKGAGPDHKGDGPAHAGRAEPPTDKSRWVRELEEALLDGRADLAVHSAKDVPAVLPDGLALIGCPPRADARDALCGADSVGALAPGARVGTSSLRRVALLRAAREDLEVVALRGNVDTRLRRLAEGDFDALVLALAGLQRLGRAAEAGTALDAATFVPAAGQGTLALQARSDDEPLHERVRAISHRSTERCLAAERSLVHALEADCDTPVGAHAVAGGPEAEELELSAFVGAPDGSGWVRDRASGPDPEALGQAVAQRLLSAGARELLGR
jgi:hydroxymethylbilane synthase